MLGPLERYMTPTLDAALLISSMAGADLGRLFQCLMNFDEDFIKMKSLYKGLTKLCLYMSKKFAHSV